MVTKSASRRRKIAPDAFRVRALRFEKGLTQAELAMRADIGKKTIEHIENGQSVRPATLRLVADALGVQISGILKNPSASSDVQRLEKFVQADWNYRRAEELREKKRIEAARYFYQSVVELAEGTWLALEALVGMAKLYKKTGMWHTAVDILDLVISSQPVTALTHPRAHYNKACYLHLWGKEKAKVLAELARALEAAPASEFYREWATKDEELARLWEDPDFKRLVEAEAVAPKAVGGAKFGAGGTQDRPGEPPASPRSVSTSLSARLGEILERFK